MGNLILALLVCLASEASKAVSCLTPNGSLSLGVPGIVEANAGFTLGETSVNPDRACTGLMLDAGVNSSAVRVALGARAFQRYDWPAAAQAALVGYFRHTERSGGLRGERCLALEGGYGVLLTMLRVGAGVCPDTGSPLFVMQFGGFL